MNETFRHAIALLAALGAVTSAYASAAPAVSASSPLRVPASAPLRATVSLATQNATQDPVEDSETRPFRIPDHAAAKERMDRAEAHANAGRHGEALVELQAILEEHRGDLLAGERPVSNGRQSSLQPVYPGAARRARDLIARMPSAARELYRERHGRDAAAAFERARERGDRRTLAEIARRWPFTEAAERAWWTLGDLELERGEEDKARSAWTHALSALLDLPDLQLTRAKDWARAAERLQSPANVASGATGAPGRAAASSSPADRERSFHGAEQRVRLARAQMEALESAPAREAAAEPADALHPSAPRASAPGSSARGTARELESWTQSRDLPDHPFRYPDALFFPARAGDALLVSTSLRLLAFHAWSGALLWDSGEPAGWENQGPQDREKFFEGIDKESVLIAPAGSGRVALAALQIPVTFVERYRYSSNVPVTTIIPDRRLFAYDLENGRPLWNHAPPVDWDGESGSFADRMSVAGPPTVVGSRVLAPYYRMQGRIDYHVGCFDLETGALLWSTSLISGQRELNMFGRPEHEFSAPPLVVAGDRVVALTQLGTIAALDLFTGELLWETLYDQIPLRRNHQAGFRAQKRDTVWRNAPPIVAEGLVVATPFDSNAMAGIDLTSGALLWSLEHDRILEIIGSTDVDVLVGTRGGTVFVAGGIAAALEARGSLFLGPPDSLRWRFTDDELSQYQPRRRPVFTGDRIVIPLSRGRVELDADTGRKLADVPWSLEGAEGNLLLAPGEMCALSVRRLSGWFDWDLLTERARAEAAAHEDDPARSLALGRLLIDRGTAEWQRGQANEARDHLEEAESVLARALRSLPGGATDSGPSPAGLEMHRVLRSQARLRAGLADTAGALAALRRARPLAPDAPTLRDTLLEELALVRGGGANGASSDPAYADALEALETCCASLSLACAAEADEADGDPRERAVGLRFTPLVGAIARRDSVPCEMPVGLWTLLEKAAAAENAADGPKEFAALHAILERYGDVELPEGRAAALVAERIGELLARGRAQGYDVFEARAGKLLDQALAERDEVGLGEVARLYPHSRAAERAGDEQLAWAVDAGDVAAVASIVQRLIPRSTVASAGATASSTTPPGTTSPSTTPSGSTHSGTPPSASLPSGTRGWRMSDASERDVRALLRLAAVFGRSGNRDLSEQLVLALARARGNVRSDIDGDGGRTLSEIAAQIPRWTPPDPAAPIGRFRQITRENQRLPGSDWEILGRLPPEDGAKGGEASADESSARDLHVVLRVSKERRTAHVTALVGRDGDDAELDLAFEEVLVPLAPASLGTATLPWSRRTALAPGRILVATGAGVSAIDAQGRSVWEWRPDGPPPASISLSYASGIAVASVDFGSGRRGYLQALDTRLGIELWRVPLADPWRSPLPLLSESRAVLLPAPGRKRGAVIDLFTGRETASFDLDTPVGPSALSDAWIDGDLLVVPWFQAARNPESNHLLAIDLSSGARAWRIALGEIPGAAREPRAEGESGGDERELAAVLQRPGRTWLLVRAAARPGDPPASAAVYELATRMGALTPLPNVRVGAADRVLGLARAGRLALSSTVLYLLGGREGSGEARLRAVDLEGGELWSNVLEPNMEELSQPPAPHSSMPQPVLSDSVVLLAWSAGQKRSAASGSTTLECLERSSGRDLSSLSLSPVMGNCMGLKLYPLGRGVLARGQGGLTMLR